MRIFTLNVSQGQFVVVTGQSESFIVDTFVPLSTSNQETEFVKGALSKVLDKKNFVGLIVTGFDNDHFCEVGLKLVLNKYRPDWVMYPSYFKKSDTADACFKFIDEKNRDGHIKKVSVLLTDNDSRFYLKLSQEFKFEVFSPYKADMGSSNNCSLVVKVTERKTGATYLITGDTENTRWEGIVQTFGDSLKADVLAAAHHGSDNGLIEAAMKKIRPDTILISAGVNNTYKHPHAGAMTMFKRYSRLQYQTNAGTGQSYETLADGTKVVTTPWKP